MGVNVANVCRELLSVRRVDMSIVKVRTKTVGVDVSIALGILMLNLANVCREPLLVRRVDMSIARLRASSVGVGVSIAKGILMFIWGST